MAVKGYTTVTRVEQYVGRTLPDEHRAHAQNLIEAAEAWIDGRLGMGWQGGVIANDRYDVFGSLIQLRRAPLISVQSVIARYPFGYGPDLTLVSGTDYELDTESGVLRLPDVSIPTYTNGRYLVVNYTTADTIPADIRLAATMLVAHWLMPILDPNSFNVQRYRIGNELEVEFRNMKLGLPQDIVDIVDSYSKKGFGSRFWFA